MPHKVEDLEDDSRFTLIKKVSYNDLLTFVIEYLRKRSAVIAIFAASCLMFLLIAIYIRISIAGQYPAGRIFLHTNIGIIGLTIMSIPVHEFLHVIPYYLAGARDIRAGMDLKQYMFYVTAHRYVAGPTEFKIVAVVPYLIISVAVLTAIPFVNGLWKWSLSLFLFFHATMCAGDFALLNFYFVNRDKKILTWDDVDRKEAYFYEEINQSNHE